ncbi:4-coumarate-CoA ligase [Clathrospora elynae]|uniref:4-coumarate-CoA ligase n=1 Tax=Clathrospora elynae TaxID=706981 RepID=A0A6A5STE1_9PLEO|nr:4-coumarate-CoA ligase [Clathrospora elynae]
MSTIRQADKTYKSTLPECEIPNVDLLTLLFESAHCTAQEDTILHAEAHDASLNITKAAARTLTKQLAHVLRTQFDVGAKAPGEDVVLAVSMGQHLLPTLFYAVAAAGGVYSAASTTSTASELARQIRDGPAKLLVCSHDFRGVAVEAAQSCGLPLRNVLVLESCPELSLESVTGEWKCELGAELDWERVTDPEVLEKRVLCLLYSSGTTGLPKGVRLSHRNLLAQAMLPAATNRRTYTSRSEPHLVIRTLAHLPTAHISAVQGYFVNPFYDAGTVFWMPRFAFPDFLAYCERHLITTMFTVPPICMAIAKSPMVTDQLRSMRIVYTGAAPISAGLQKAAGAKMGTGVFVSQTWGMTEVCGGCTHMPPYETDGFAGSVSPLMQNMVLRIVDDAGHDVPDGHRGEALLKGPLVTTGYHNNASANSIGFVDGWLRTGDVALVKDGTLFVVDRKKELIKYNGLQVAPAELEALLTSHSLIHDAAVIGVLNDEGNELPRAYVVADREKVSEEDIEVFFEREASEFKKLRGGVVFVDAIPRTASGKILRKELRDRAKKERGDEQGILKGVC